MADAKEIQNRMKSIQDTMKITNAMYMISSNKLQKAKKNLEATEPYFYTMQATISRILRHMPDMKHRYLEEADAARKEKRRGYIVITGDKGLAGAYNHNVLKVAEQQLAQKGSHTLFVVGELGRQYFASKGIQVDTQFRYTVQNPTMHRARMISGRVLDLYDEQKLDEIYVIFTRMANSLQVEVEMLQLLPLQHKNFEQTLPVWVRTEQFLLLPTPEAVLESIIPNYVNGFIYGALVESFCSEQNSRMLAMQSANQSANEMLHGLAVQYNRVRQAAITQEITEVIGGAKALRRRKLQ